VTIWAWLVTGRNQKIELVTFVTFVQESGQFIENEQVQIVNMVDFKRFLSKKLVVPESSTGLPTTSSCGRSGSSTTRFWGIDKCFRFLYHKIRS